tara:strand:- start:569 stop:820 length:252 start_codon:yes stop_codon:yes gene_type:complete
MNKSRISIFLNNPLVKPFIFYSIFRAFYGAGILLVTWLFATNTNSSPIVSILFLLFSMIFSRVLMKKIKEYRASKEIISAESK